MGLVDDDTLQRDAVRQATLSAKELETEVDEDTEHPYSRDPFDARPPPRLNHYMLLSKLGQGGMGVVHAAYDEKLDRKVAIKLLRTNSDRKAHKRLVREAQSLAKLSHPNVVQIYEIGTSDELLFLVMEFVKGQTLRAWLCQRPRSRAEILAVFRAAGRGLAAAHAVGLVHRDFKPDNLMIRDDGRVLVMDFGLAHLVREGDGIDGEPGPDAPSLIEPSGLTATGVLVGTPAYMAPEQFEGRETDARTDQFSFCVALWEALHGQRPFAGASVIELSLSVCSGSVTAPATSGVPSWLRKLLARGLEVEATQRWPSLDALLDALDHDPTRRRRGLALALGVLVVLVGGALALQLAQARARDREQRACEAAGQAIMWTDAVQTTLAERFAATKLGYAEGAWTHTRALLDDYAHEWAATRTSVCIEAEIEHARDEASYAVITSCLDEERAQFEGLLAAWAKLDGTTVARATSAAAGLTPVSMCTNEVQLAQRMQPPADVNDTVVDLRAQLEHIAALHFAGKYEEARTRALQVLSEAEALGWRPLIAEARYALATQQHRLGEYDVARAGFERTYADAIGAGHDIVALNAANRLAVVIGDKLAQVEPGLYWGQLGLMYIERLGFQGSFREAKLFDDIASVHARAGANDEALELHLQALALTEAEFGPDHLHVAAGLNNIGTTYWNKGDYDQALAAFERALAIRTAILGPEHPEIGGLLNNMGAVTWGRGDPAGALELFRRALTVREHALGPMHPEVANTLGNVGAAEASLGHDADALVSFRRALAIQEATLAPDHPDLAGSLVNVAIGLRQQGKLSESLAHHERALAILEASLGPEHAHVAMALNNIGIVQHMQGQLELAKTTHERALAIRTAAFGPDNAEVSMSLINLGNVLVDMGQLDEAIANYRRGLEIREATRGPEHATVAEALDDLGVALRQTGRRAALDEALAAHRRALDIYTKALGPEHPDLALSLDGIGLALAERGELETAIPTIERGLQLRTASDASPLDLANSEFALARVLWTAGQHERARELAGRAREHFTSAGATFAIEQLDTWLVKPR